MVLSHHIDDRPWEYDVPYNIDPRPDMGFHQSELFEAEATGPLNNIDRDRHFADIVHQGAQIHTFRLVRAQP